MRYADHEVVDKRLTAEQELDLFRRYHKGDATAGEIIVGRYLLFARKLAGQAAAGRLSDDDVVSAAHDGLLRAMRSFDPEIGVRFYGYAHLVIRGEALSKLGKEARHSELKRRYAEHIEGDDEVSETDYAQGDTHEVVRELLKKHAKDLTAVQRKVVKLRLRGKTCQQVGEKMGVTRQRVDQIWREALGVLRPFFQEAFQ